MNIYLDFLIYKCFLISFFLTLIFSGAEGSVIFSEIYIRPNNSVFRDQWIELYNLGAEDIDLLDYRIEDGEGSYTTLTNWTLISTAFSTLRNQKTNNTLLKAGGFAVVFDNDFTDGENILSNIPPNTLLLTVNGNSLKGENTVKTSDVLFLLDAEGQQVDVYGTPEVEDAVPILEVRSGFSIEKIFYDERDTEKNWGESFGAAGHSIGTTNALTVNYSKEPAVRFLLNPAFVPNLKKEEVIGRDLPLDIYAIDRNGKISFVFDETVDLAYFDDLKVSDDGYIKNKITRGKLISFECIGGRGGRFSIFSIYPGAFEIKISGGGLATVSTRLRFDPFRSGYVGKVVISEVMYLTATATNLAGNVYDELDFIEIYNTTEDNIDLHNWILLKNESSEYVLSDVLLKRKSHLLLVANVSDFNGLYDSGLPDDLVVDKVEVAFGNLSQDGDITLLDNQSNEVDILQYTDSYLKEVSRYGQKNRLGQYIDIREFISLERKSFVDVGLWSFNWGNSSYQLGNASFLKTSSGVSDSYTLPILATPGFANSRSFLEKKKLFIEILRKVYVLDRNSGKKLIFELLVNSPSLIEARVYSQTGAYLGILATEIVGTENRNIYIFFDGNLNGRQLGVGLYFLRVKAVRADTAEESTDKMYFAIK